MGISSCYDVVCPVPRARIVFLGMYALLRDTGVAAVMKLPVAPILVTVRALYTELAELAEVAGGFGISAVEWVLSWWNRTRCSPSIAK